MRHIKLGIIAFIKKKERKEKEKLDDLLQGGDEREWNLICV